MDSEFYSLLKQQTWSLVPPLVDKNVVTCKWVYKLKRHSDGTITRYKARLVVRGIFISMDWIMRKLLALWLNLPLLDCYLHLL